MAEPFIGEIIMVGFNFAPVYWATCDGQILSISQNTALFSLLGTTYGGNGTTNFALPDLRGRTPLYFGQGPGLPNYVIGQKSGAISSTVLPTNLPAHTHPVALAAVSGSGETGTPGATASLATPVNGEQLYSDKAPNTTLKEVTTGNAGSGQPFSIVQPYTTVNFIIALQGIYPSRQ